MVVADPDEALIEAIAEAILTAYLPVRDRFTPWKSASKISDEQRETAQTYARAAYAATVEHLGLVEEAGLHPLSVDLGPCDGACQMVTCDSGHHRHRLVWVNRRRLVSRWVEVDHDSE